MKSRRLLGRLSATVALRLGVAAIAACLHAGPMQAHAAQEPRAPSRWAILLSGISGDGDLQQGYVGMIRDLHGILTGPMRVPAEQVHVLVDDPSLLPGLRAHRSTRAAFEEVCQLVARQAAAGDQVFLFIAGHGSYDGRSYRLNLVGPDATAEELAACLSAIPARNFVVVNTTTCSGASVAAFSGPGRIVVTATRSGQERNLTHMGRYFVEALKDNSGDADKNGRVSILEAFSHAVLKVETHYSAEGNLQTEHPVLEDSGEGEPHPKPGPENGDGLLARTTYLDAAAPGRAETAAAPEDRRLADEAASLERQIEALKYAKPDMPEGEYEKKLEELLVRLAEINLRLRKK